MLVIGLLLGSSATVSAAQAAAPRTPTPALPHLRSVRVSAVRNSYRKPSPMPRWQAQPTIWPTGSADVTLTGARTTAGGLVRAGGLPLSIGPARRAVSAARAATSEPAAVRATVASRETTAALGIDGVVLGLQRSDGVDAAGAIHMSLSYGAFRHAFGADWGSRLRLVSLPPCALTTPALAACRVTSQVAAVNNAAAQTLTADVVVPRAGPAQPSLAVASTGMMVLAATSDTGGGGGDFTATSLKPSGSWQAGGNSDSFGWSYPITVPPVPGGLEPKIGLSYNSQSQDGLTSSTNSQASWIGDGWDYSPGFIERSYQSCHENPTGTTKTWDSCWSSQNSITVSLNGSNSTLIKDDATGTYHAQNDANERVEYLTGADNGAQNGEYWRITAPDGTQYYFGKHKLPGWVSGNSVTNSVWTAPVFATASGQPCYNTTWANSWCQQAYRWNLDYVVDTHQDTISYFYTTETNYYARNLGSIANTPYVRGGYLNKISYGQRDGQVYTTQPAAQVTFSTMGRCNTSATGCATSTLSKSTAANWPDVPEDLDCANGATCNAQSPSFWSAVMLTGIQTQALVNTTETNVDSWSLSHSFPATGDSTTPALWLDTIVRTGQDTTAGGSAAITLPAVTFTGTPLSNRVNVTNGYPPITRRRMHTITTETGEVISVDYSTAVCTTCVPADASQNTTLAYPVYWTPTGQTSPIRDWFNKYVVTHVTEQDPTGGSANDDIVTTYTPVGSPAWHYNDNTITPSSQRTWDQWRGYGGMTVSTGTAPDPVTKTTYTYFRGMDGDTLPNSGTRSVTVTDSRADPAVRDADQYAGMTYETQVFNGSSLVTDTITDAWSSAATATHALSGLPDQHAYHTDSAATQVYTPLASGATRHTRTAKTHDGYGRVTAVDDQGDTGVSGDDLCTTTTFADNTTLWIFGTPAEVKTVSVGCGTSPSLPADAVSDEQTYYDQSTTLGAAPTVGDTTMTRRAASYSGSTPTFVTVSQITVDQYGRPTAVTDAVNHTTRTSYSPATGVSPTSTTVTSPVGLVTTTAYDTLRGMAKSKTDPASYVTTVKYDALGRLTDVYRPGQSAPNPPNVKYAYTLSNSGPSLVDTYVLNDDSSYRLSRAFFDSMLRVRETQTQTVDNGRTIADTVYNTDGWQSETTDPYYNASPVSSTLVQAQVGTVPSATGFTYDNAGRQTIETAYALGTATWQTTHTYGGDFVTTVPPTGATATTVVSDAHGRISHLIQYHAGVNPDYLTAQPADYADTRYTYRADGKRATLTDPAGNGWSWQYNLLGYETDKVDPDTGHSVSTYDNAGRQLTATDGRGRQTTFTYDDDNRRTGSYDTTTTSTLSTANQLASWTYDTLKKGMLTSSTSYSNGDVFTRSVLAYNNLGKVSATKVTLTGESTALVPSTGYTTSYGYTLTGLVQAENAPASGGLPSETITYGHDKFGAPTTVTSTGGASWTYVAATGYDEFGKPLQYSFGPSTSRVADTMTYDPQTNALTGIRVTASSASGDIDNTTYTFGNSAVSKGAGLLTRTVDRQNAGAIVDTQCFTYDFAMRAQAAWSATDDCTATPRAGSSATVGGPVSPYWQSWTYDAAGNRETQTDHDLGGESTKDTITTYHYPTAGSTSDQPHTLTSTTATGPNAAAQTASYTYDLSGNAATSTGGAAGNQSFTWDNQGKLASATTPAGTTAYVYDAEGNQVVRRDPGSTTFFNGDEQLVLNTATSVVSGTRYYAIGGATIAARTSAGKVSYLIPDRQGTSRLSIDSTTQAVTRRQYLPFGQLRGSKPSSWPGTMGYVGGDEDGISGLVTLGARVYAPALGRFLSADPLLEGSDPRQLNGYSYSGNDPITGSDPSGLIWVNDGGSGVPSSGCGSDNACSAHPDEGADPAPVYVPVSAHVLVRNDDPRYGRMSNEYAKFLRKAHINPARKLPINQEMAIWHQICVTEHSADNICGDGFRDQLIQIIDDGGFANPVPMENLMDAGGAFLLGSDFSSTGGVARLHPLEPLVAAEGVDTLYHYTNKGSLDKIMESKELWASKYADNPKDARFGDGQYLSNIPPGTKSNASLSATFVRVPWNGKRFTNYIAVDVRGLEVMQGRDRPSVFVILNDVPLSLEGRIVGYGQNEPFQDFAVSGGAEAGGGGGE